MLSVSDAQLEEVAFLIGAAGSDDQAVESSVVTLVENPALARRLIDWLPEAFGMVLISHMDTVRLPTTFSVKNRWGKWVEFDLHAEPIFPSAIRLATHMYHNGPGEIFSHIAMRSALLGAVNRALNAGDSIKGGVLSGPALLGIPAETYATGSQSLWQKLFR